MNNGGRLILMLVGIGCIISGMICLGVRAYIQSEEGFDVEPDETTPEGKTQQYVLNTLLMLGIALIVSGIIILIFSLIG